jgi:hypothetical protein
MRNVRARNLFALAVVAALAVATAARAEDTEGACSEDAARLCGDAGPSKGSAARCLRKHEEELSEGCKSLLAEPQQRRADAGEACGDDAARLCADVQPGRSNTGMLNCLRANAQSLSDACRNAVDALPGKKREGAPASM